VAVLRNPGRPHRGFLSMSTELTKAERQQIGEILKRRAQEIGGFANDYRNDPKHYGSVELALSREIDRLRRLADRVNPAEPEQEEA
jgi:hypothetical protein